MKVPKKIKEKIRRLNKLESQSKALRLDIIRFLENKEVDEDVIDFFKESVAEMQNEDNVAEGLIYEIENI